MHCLHRTLPCSSRVSVSAFPVAFRALASKAAAIAAEADVEVHRDVVDGKQHVTAINAGTRCRSIVELSLPKKTVPYKTVRLPELPAQATAGLREALLECGRNPKQIQNEADQLSEKLSQRRFPAPPEVVRALRKRLKLTLRPKGADERIAGDALIDEATRDADELQLRNKVDKLLKKAHYNWQPMEISSREMAAAYALARFAPNFAEISRALDEFSRIPEFTPSTVLDYGCGSGAAFWALHERFGDAVREYCMVDTSDLMTQFAMDIMRGDDRSGNALVHQNVSFRRHLVPSPQATYDLVIAHRLLVEIGSHETRVDMLAELWRRTNRFLVIIEDSKRDAFEALLDIRDYLLSEGQTLNVAETVRLLKERGVWDRETENLFKDREITSYQKWQIVREKLPPGTEPPTNLSPASVFAPCPHDLGCPKSGTGVCTVPVRWKVIRADGKKTKREGDGTERGQMCYVILEKSVREEGGSMGRILENRKLGGHNTCDVCTAFNGIQRITVSRRGGHLYRMLRSRRDGDLFPLEMHAVATEDPFDIYNKAKAELKRAEQETDTDIKQ